jgi:hypothetical protein
VQPDPGLGNWRVCRGRSVKIQFEAIENHTRIESVHLQCIASFTAIRSTLRMVTSAHHSHADTPISFVRSITPQIVPRGPNRRSAARCSAGPTVLE